MNNTHYRLALITIWKGIVIFMRSWGVTLNRLLHDVLHGIARHWVFAVTLVVLYVIMFVTMANSRAQYHHVNMVNYQLSQSVDSLTLMINFGCGFLCGVCFVVAVFVGIIIYFAHGD